jgi:cathepsin X
LPNSFFWGDKNGINYLGYTRNQNMPKYCNSGWAHAVISSISDRINILNNNQPIMVELSV